MANRGKMKKLRKIYSEMCTDDALIHNVVGIVGEVLREEWPADTRMSASYTTGDLVAAKGFYANEFLVNDLLGTFVARAIRIACLACNIEVVKLDKDVMAFIQSTDEQQARVLPKLQAALIKQYGAPAEVDQVKIDKIIDVHKALLRLVFGDALKE